MTLIPGMLMDVFPTGVGMNRRDDVLMDSPYDVFPTGVGMNRRHRAQSRSATCSPQAWG